VTHDNVQIFQGICSCDEQAAHWADQNQTALNIQQPHEYVTCFKKLHEESINYKIK